MSSAQVSAQGLAQLVPMLSASDPGYSKEGGLDPLGLYALGDSLGVRLVPGVRERMADPRYLTAIAMGMVVCEGLPPDQLASDGKSEPWQVFEWYVVEGLVRTYGDGEEVQGLPGVEKVRAALRNDMPISAGNYLKTARVFGFHGVYRGLGEAMGLFDDAGLLARGWELVEAWERDQGLEGFHSADGEFVDRRRSLHSAVAEGLDKGATARSRAWSGWDFLGRYLAPRASGPRELEVLQRALYGEPAESRHQVFDRLVSESGQRVWRESEQSERRFHEVLYDTVSEDVRALLDAISAYEHFSRLVQDAFDDCLYHLSSGYGRQGPDELARAPCVERAVSEVSEAFDRAAEALAAVDESGRFTSTFASLGDASDAPSWTAALLDHHYRNQARKPPNGKNPWFDRFDDGSVAVRTAYRREQGGRGDDEYVHYYRTRPLDSFARELKLVVS